MKLKLNRLRAQILYRLARENEMAFDQLAQAFPLSPQVEHILPGEWRAHVAIQIELLALYGAIDIAEHADQRMCVAPARLRLWARRQRPKRYAAHKKSVAQSRPAPGLGRPLAAAGAMAAATAGCASWFSPPAVQAPAVPVYNAERASPPERVEQFYNRRTGSMVYRFCSGHECPTPTPKTPSPKVALVTEIHPEGTRVAVEPSLASFAPASPAAQPTAAQYQHAPQTAGHNKSAAAVVEQLNQQRRALAVAAGAAPVPQAQAVGLDRSAQLMGRPPTLSTPPAAAIPTPPPSITHGSPVVPAQGGPRAPTAPQASATFVAPVTAVSYTVPIQRGDKAAEQGFAQDAASIEAFVSRWAALWSDKNNEAYFSMYGKNFLPTYGTATSSAAWKQHRSTVMGRPGDIKVQVNVVKVRQRQDKTTVRFWQKYESSRFSSRVLKSFELVVEDGQWKIHRERLIPVEARPAVALAASVSHHWGQGGKGRPASGPENPFGNRGPVS